MKILDRACIVLLTLGTLGHLFGTFSFFEFGSQVFVWSLSGSLAAGLIVVLNILRHLKDDMAIATTALISGLLWIGIVLLFGQSIGNISDPRVLMHAVSTFGLCWFSFLQMRRQARK